MENVDTQATTEVTADISATETQSPNTPEASTSEETAQAQSQDNQTDKAASYIPFSNGGKEKFKVNGQEFEWDWETTRKYAQLGRSGQVAMERAAQTEKKAKEAFQKLIETAKQNPVEVLKILNPDFDASTLTHRQAQAAATEAVKGTEGKEAGIDPRDQKIQELEKRYQSVAEVLEKQEIEKERQAIETELTEAVKKYPELDNKIFKAHVKTQYRQALANGIEDLTIDDVAFHVAQEIREMKAAEEKKKLETAKENRKRAPVSTHQGGSSGEKKAGYTFDEIRKMAGLA
jgi:ribosomal protein L22